MGNIGADPNRKQEYEQAYQAWQQQLAGLHRVMLEGESLEPPRVKGLLNREARAKERYDTAREALLGLDTAHGDDPFNL